MRINNKIQKLIPIMTILLCITGIFCIVFHKYLFQEYYFVSKGLWGSDLLRANIPTYYQLYDSIQEGGVFWSWKMGIGTSMFTHADVYFDPFTYILFIFGRDNIIKMMLVMFATKLLAEGLTFFYYLQTLKINKWASVISSIIYAFCGYSLIMGCNYALGTILVYAPLVLSGLEKYITTQKKGLLILSLFLTCIYSYYYFFSIGIISAIYIIIRCIQEKKKIFFPILCLLIIGILTFLISAFALFPQIELVLNTPRVSGATDVKTGFFLFIPQIKVFFTGLIRCIGNDLLGNPVTGIYSGLEYNGGNDYFQISTYCSFLFIPLFIHLILTRKEIRKKIFSLFFICIIVIIFPLFSFVFNAFSTINARWMFIISIMECLVIALSLHYIFQKKEISFKSFLLGILFSYFIITISIAIIYIGTENYLSAFKLALNKNNNKILLLSCLYFVILMFVFWFKNLKKTTNSLKFIFSLGMITLIAIDTYANYYDWYTSDPNSYTYTKEMLPIYEDESSKIITSIQNADNNWYRIHKNFDSVYDCSSIPSENDAMAQNYYGLKSYNSVNNDKYVRFLQEVGIYVCIPLNTEYYKSISMPPEDLTGPTLNYIDGVENDFLLMNYLGVKYYLAKENTAQIDSNYNFLYAKNGIEVYENTNAYPLAFVNTKIMSYTDFCMLPDNEKRMTLLSYTIIDDQNITSTDFKIDCNISELATQKQDAFELISFNQDEIQFNIDVEADNSYLSFSIPYDKNWHIYIDDKEVESLQINISLLGTKINSGNHNIKIKYVPKLFYLGILISFLTIFICTFLLYVYKKRYVNAPDFSKITQKMTNYIKKTNINYLFLLFLLFFEIIFWLIIFISRGTMLNSYFVRDTQNSYMDFFNMLANIDNATPYSNGANYPAMCFAILKILFHMIPRISNMNDGFVLRNYMPAQIVFFVFLILVILIIYELIKISQKGHPLYKIIFAIELILSGPFLFTIERGNLIILSFCSLMIYCATYNSGNKKLRYIGYFALAISSSLKIYTALFGLLSLTKASKKEIIHLLILGILFFFLPFFIFDGTDSIINMLHGMAQANAHQENVGMAYNYSFNNLIRLISTLLGITLTKIPTGYKVLAILFCAILFILHKEPWKKCFAIILLCLWIPSFSYTYTLILFIIPLVMYFRRENKFHNTYSIIYRVLFLLIFAPIALPNLANLDVEHARLPLTWPTLIVNITILIFSIVLLYEGITQHKGKNILKIPNT